MKKTEILRNVLISVGALVALARWLDAGTMDGLLNLSNATSASLQFTIDTFDVPGAGTSPGQGTIPYAINPAGTIMGYYVDPNDAYHGFLRDPNVLSPRLTFRERAPVPTKALCLRALTQLGRSRDFMRTPAMPDIPSPAIGTAASPRSMFPVQALAPTKAR
jgi:hypothetical protein